MLRLIDEKGTEIDPFSEEGYRRVAELFTKVSVQHKLMYEISWLGIPIIQYPADILMMQELIWKTRPDVIVETGFAHGGSAIFYASMLELLGRGKVVSVEVEIRKYNRVAIDSHPLSRRCEQIEGSSVNPAVVTEVKRRIGEDRQVMVVLDSNHSYDHVAQELELYAPLVSPRGYIVAMDGLQGDVWDIPRGKPEWKEDNPRRAIHDFIARHPEWEIDPHYNRLMVTSNPDAFLRRKYEP
ncbi:MAG: class I SAM-dependent methyltransferase [Rhodospirillaceae bacterium]|nr:class I SAM-dependent methyltransferase [Rhodospirillaceae bacterium]